MCLFLVFLLSHDSPRAVLPLKGTHSEQFVLLGVQNGEADELKCGSDCGQRRALAFPDGGTEHRCPHSAPEELARFVACWLSIK